MRRPRAQGRRFDVATLALFVLLTVLLTWPLLPRISSHVPGDPHDTLYTIYAMSWTWHAVGGSEPLWDANIFYPHREVLAYGDPIFGLTLLGTPFRLLTRNPVLIFNILFLLSFLLCAVGAYALARRLTGSRPAALLAGLILAFCPYRFAHIGHLELLYFAWIPMTLIFMHRFFERPTWGRTIGMAVCYVMQVACCAYYGAFLTLFAALYVVYEAGRTGLWQSRRFWGQSAAFLAISAAALTPYVLPFLKFQARIRFIRPAWEVVHYSAELQHYLAVPPWNRTLGPLLGKLGGVEWEHFPGLVAIGLSAWGFARLWRKAKALPLPPAGDRFRVLFRIWEGFNATLLLLVLFLAVQPGFSLSLAGLKITGRHLQGPLTLLLASVAVRLAVDSRRRSRWLRLFKAAPVAARFYAGAGLLGFLLSLGPSIRLFGRPIMAGPYGWIYAWMPGFKGLRGANRFSIFLFLALALFAAYAVADWLRLKRPARGWAAAALAVLIAAESWAVPLPLSKIPLGDEIPAIYRAVAALPEGASLVELPMPARDDEEWKDAWPVYYSTYHWRKLVNGYSGSMPPAYRLAHEAMQQFPSKAAFDLLESLQVGYVLAHVPALPESHRADFLRRMSRHRHRADPVAEAEGDVLYRILPWAAAHAVPEPELRRVGDRRLWSAVSTYNRDSAGLAFDGDPKTFWTDGIPQQKGEFFRLDLGRVERFSRIVLGLHSCPSSYPRSYDVETSLDGKEWTVLDYGRDYFPIIAKKDVVNWNAYRAVISRVAAEARFIRIRLAESVSNGRHWAIGEFELWGE